MVGSGGVEQAQRCVQGGKARQGKATQGGLHGLTAGKGCGWT